MHIYSILKWKFQNKSVNHDLARSETKPYFGGFSLLQFCTSFSDYPFLSLLFSSATRGSSLSKMSFAAYKMMHYPTGIENCASGFITHSRADFVPRIPPIQTDDLDTEWPARREIGPIPNLIITAANVLEVYIVRVQEEGSRESKGHVESKRGGLMDGLTGASLEIACHYRFAPFWDMSRERRTYLSSVYPCWSLQLK